MTEADKLQYILYSTVIIIVVIIIITATYCRETDSLEPAHKWNLMLDNPFMSLVRIQFRKCLVTRFSC